MCTFVAISSIHDLKFLVLPLFVIISSWNARILKYIRILIRFMVTYVNFV